ncbi:MAG: carbon-nitrogen family hydrolase [Acidimicrobiales bacterium]
MSRIRVAAVQQDTVWEDPGANFARLAPRVDAAVAGGADLVVLCEMYSTGFSMATDRTAEKPDGPSTAFLVDQAEAHGIWMGGSIPVVVDDGLPRNRFVLAGPDGQMHHYDKIHPFSYSGEHERFAAGDEFVTVDLGGFRVGLFVCYDLRFADEFWALAHDVDAYLIPANWPTKRREHWKALLVARAIENQAYVVGVNRVGTGGKLDYSGDSLVIDPFGEVIAAAAAVETTLIVDLDADRVREVREKFPFLPDRR